MIVNFALPLLLGTILLLGGAGAVGDTSASTSRYNGGCGDKGALAYLPKHGRRHVTSIWTGKMLRNETGRAKPGARKRIQKAVQSAILPSTSMSLLILPLSISARFLE